MSVAMLPMSKQFGWSPTVQGLAQAAFLWGYMSTQLLGGTLADKIGGKIVIAGAIVFFSLASLFLPFAASMAPASATLAAVAVIRFLVGAGEGVVLPSMNNMVAVHVPPRLKARALGTIFSGFHCGNLVGLAVSPAVIVNYGWPSLFVLFGVLGAPLLLFWLFVTPALKSLPEAGRSSVPPASKPHISSMHLLRRRATIAIIVANFVNHWGYFIFLSWIPTYFAAVHGLDLKASSLMAFMPWVAMAVGSSVAGLLADKLVTKHPVLLVRKWLQAIAFFAPATSMFALALPDLSPSSAAFLFVIALFFQSLGQAGFVANMSDIAPGASGQLFGLSNTFGSFAGVVGVMAAGTIYEWTGSFSPLFAFTSALYIVGAFVYMAWADTRPLFL